MSSAVQGAGDQASRAALMEAMQAGPSSCHERAVARTFSRVTDRIAKVEAKAVQNTRQLHEVRTEMQHTTEEVERGRETNLHGQRC